jgi:hypothetical protein
VILDRAPLDALGLCDLGYGCSGVAVDVIENIVPVLVLQQVVDLAKDKRDSLHHCDQGCGHRA